jgi:hypothetical protein
MASIALSNVPQFEQNQPQRVSRSDVVQAAKNEASDPISLSW